MRIAFHAPMKPPDWPTPSGDRTMARLLCRALALAGHEPVQAARLRCYDGTGDAVRQRRLGDIGAKLADRLVRRWRCLAPADRPGLWFTYHVYHKAPDWIGPTVARALGIPYVIAEASFAPKRRDGPWAIGHRQAALAIAAADCVLGLNNTDRACVLPLLRDPGIWTPMLPFLDIAPFAAAAKERDAHRHRLVERLGLAPGTTVLLAVGMMRPGDKQHSWHCLAETLGALRAAIGSRAGARGNVGSWTLVAAGDGVEKDAVMRAFAAFGTTVQFLGRVLPDDMPGLYAASDLLVWPAVGEAWGMALLEAQAAGLPVVAGRSGGVGDVVVDGKTGILVPAGDAQALAGTIADMLCDKAMRVSCGTEASRYVSKRHSLEGAAQRLGEILRFAGDCQ